MTLRFLVAESEPAEARERRRESVGRSSGESFQDVLREIATGAHMLRVAPADAGAALPGGKGLSEFDAIFLTGSPLHLYQDTPEARRTVEFMRGVFASRTPAFGSCAGLQVATVAAGGAVRRAANGREAGFARRIYPTPAGATHPMLAGRPPAFDALSVHTDEVATLPEDAVLLAANAMTAVQAAEIRFQGGVFWGVQYHPELDLDQIASALERQQEDLVAKGLARSFSEARAFADDLRLLHQVPERRDVAWRLGADREVLDARRRRSELHNFIQSLVLPTRVARCRA
jgi:GMP synthase (glutamine-hydrolysing)